MHFILVICFHRVLLYFFYESTMRSPLCTILLHPVRIGTLVPQSEPRYWFFLAITSDSTIAVACRYGALTVDISLTA